MNETETTHTRVFHAPAKEPHKPLKEGHKRCPLCFQGVRARLDGIFRTHTDEYGRTCGAGGIVRAGYVYRGMGVDTLGESA